MCVVSKNVFFTKKTLGGTDFVGLRGGLKFDHPKIEKSRKALVLLGSEVDQNLTTLFHREFIGLKALLVDKRIYNIFF